MNWLDYIIVIAYILFFLGMVFFFKENKNSKDYFLGGKTIRTLLMANGLFRFPVVLVYSVMGLILGGLITLAPDFLDQIAQTTQKHFPEEFATNGIKADLMVPVFIIKYLPHGLIGILMIGILSAAMSSLSSTVNSLSAVTVEDFFIKEVYILMLFLIAILVFSFFVPGIFG